MFPNVRIHQRFQRFLGRLGCPASTEWAELLARWKPGRKPSNTYNRTECAKEVRRQRRIIFRAVRPGFRGPLLRSIRMQHRQRVREYLRTEAIFWRCIRRVQMGSRQEQVERAMSQECTGGVN